MTPQLAIFRSPQRFARAAAVALLMLLAQMAAAQEEFHYDAGNVDTAAHWAGRSALANALMFSGLGEPFEMSMSERDTILKHAGYTLRPPMPDMAMAGAVYAGGDPTFTMTPDFADTRTLRWDAATFERTLDPEAQAWSIVKMTAPEFHLNYHEARDERRVALMMLPQARTQGETLAQRLGNPDGLFAARLPEGEFGEPRPAQQTAVLWAASNVVLAATSERDDYWHKAARDLLDPRPWRALGDAAFAALEALPPDSPADRAIAVQALGRYAIASDDDDKRSQALGLARGHADALKAIHSGAALEDLAFSLYGLIEAARLFEDDAYRKTAVDLFRSQLAPLWDEAIGAFRGANGDTAYTPRTLAALAAALNALRWHGPDEAAQEADRLYPQLFETVLVRAGMLLSSPLPLVPDPYVDREPPAHFAHPALPSPQDAGLAPVFAAAVHYVDAEWSVTDKAFTTANAMLLANMLVMEREGRADAFLPPDRLAVLQRP